MLEISRGLFMILCMNIPNHEFQRTLFPVPHAANFATAVSVLEPVVTPLAWKAHQDVMADFGDRRIADEAFRRLEAGESAQFIHRQVVGTLQSLLKIHGNGLNHRWFKVKNMDVLNVDDKVHLCFKKVDTDLRRSNYPTEHNNQFWRQSGAGKPLRLLFGYRPNESWNRAATFITLPSGRRVLHSIAVDDQTARLIELLTPARTVVQQAPKKPKFTAKPKTSIAREDKRRKTDDGQATG